MVSYRAFEALGLLAVFASGVVGAVARTSSRLSARDYTYSSVSEHCSDLWSFNGTQEAPMVVTNVTLYAFNATDNTPAFCEVIGNVATYVGVTMRLPAYGKDWNSYVHQQGCGGPCGYMYMDSYWPDIPNPLGWSWSRDMLQRGYMTSTTNLGHDVANFDSSGSFMFAYNNRTAELNFACKCTRLLPWLRLTFSDLGTHYTVLVSKAVVKEYYGVPHTYSLYRGSSTGGRQGLVAAQRYPTDFDGIAIGAPASNETAIGSIQQVWFGLANKDEDGNNVLVQADVQPLHETALRSCDHLDGLVDGLIDNPDRCVIDWGLIQCSSSRKIFNETTCFSDKKVKHAKIFYTNPRDSNGTEIIRSAMLPGSELAWNIYQFYISAGNWNNACYNGTINFNIAMAFEEDFLPLDWKPEQYDWDAYPAKLRYMESIFTGTNTDLAKFKENGGKMMITQGWWDYNVTPQFTVKYFLDLQAHMGTESVGEFVKMFMTNGQYHTWGTGPGATAHLDLAGHLEKWVVDGVAPEKIVGTKFSTNGYGTENFTRPAYPWPSYASYTGVGEWRDAENWEPKNREIFL